MFGGRTFGDGRVAGWTGVDAVRAAVPATRGDGDAGPASPSTARPLAITRPPAYRPARVRPRQRFPVSSPAVRTAAPPDDAVGDPDEPPAGFSPAAVGTAFGIVGAVGYTLANVALRGLSKPGDFDWSLWVTFMKAVPVATAAWVLVSVRIARGLSGFPRGRALARLVAVGVLAQFGGNLLFQVALGQGGLALTVPVLFSAILLTGAALGWVVLGEPVSRRAAGSIALLIAAVTALGVAADRATDAVAHRSDGWAVAAAMGTALLSGVSFGVLGVVVRRTLPEVGSLSGTLLPISTVGVLSLGGTVLARTGLSLPADTTAGQWGMLAAAGVCNACAFFAIAAAFERIAVVRVNLLNASQAAMCAAAGVLLFDEPLTVWLAVGTGLTVAGLVLLGVREHRGANE